MEIYVHIAIAVWWSFASVVFVGLRAVDDESALRSLTMAVFWPIFIWPGLAILLWRIPFRTVEQMRADIRARGQWKEYLKWVDSKKEPTP